MDILQIGIGAGGVLGTYLGYLGCTKGLPAVAAKLKGWWTAGKTDSAEIKGDVADAQTAVAALETKFSPLIARLRTDVDALLGKTSAGGAPAAAPAAAKQPGT